MGEVFACWEYQVDNLRDLAILVRLRSRFIHSLMIATLAPIHSR
jgi:hypothetical protein